MLIDPYKAVNKVEDAVDDIMELVNNAQDFFGKKYCISACGERVNDLTVKIV